MSWVAPVRHRNPRRLAFRSRCARFFRAGWLSLLLLEACPLPEDQFVLSGRAVDGRGQPRRDVEVRLLRNQVSSQTRCDALEPLEIARTDDDGKYVFTLVRQQITGGVTGRRFFRVEADHEERVISQTFWFPDADLDLGPLEPTIPRDAWRVTESWVDDHVGWRSESAGGTSSLELPSRQLTSWTQREWRTVPVDSLGRQDVVPVDWAAQGRWLEQGGSTVVPAGRGAECPFIDVTPCPLTDGRYVPFELAPNTRTLVLNFKRETTVSPLVFHGLLLERPAVKVRLEFNFVLDFDNWNRLGTSTIDRGLQERSANRCTEPGAFLGVATQTFIKPVLLRIAFEDEAGDLVPILSLAEIRTP